MPPQPITVELAEAAVKRNAAASSDPILTDAEVTAIVAGAKRADREGREIIDEAWAPTFDVVAATIEAWQVKAGKAAGRPDLARGGSSLRRGAVHEACLRMANIWRRRQTGSAVMLAPNGRQPDPALLVIANGPDLLEDAGLGGASGSPALDDEFAW